MTNKSKDKGYRFEKEVEDLAKKYDNEAKRAWGSNGISIGWSADVDLEIFNLPWQAKRRKTIAKYVLPPDGCHGTIMRQDRGKAYAVVPLEWLLEIMEKVYK